MTEHNSFKISERLAPSAIISSARFPATPSNSFCLLSSMFIQVPYHRTTAPVGSQSGSCRSKNH